MNALVAHRTKEETRSVWTAPIASELRLVESRLRTAVSSDVSVALELSMHLFSAGGKRIRPALTVMSAFASGLSAHNSPLIDVATATELFHTASLIHDDVVDETHERRGTPTVAAQWGNQISVLGGDFLLARTFCLLAEVGNLDVLQVVSGVASTMTECEILQASSEGDFEAWKANYWRIIEGKTAAFMAGCCECGAILSGADHTMREALTQYGFHLGLAFQITDDVLDIVGDPARTGKDIATDMMHGKFTLPVILALSQEESDSRSAIEGLFNRDYLSSGEAQEVAKLVIDMGAVTAARTVARQHVEQAIAQLSLLPASDYRSALQMLANSVVDREF